MTEGYFPVTFCMTIVHLRLSIRKHGHQLQIRDLNHNDKLGSRWTADFGLVSCIPFHRVPTSKISYEPHSTSGELSTIATPSRKIQWSSLRHAFAALPHDPWSQLMLWARYIRIDVMVTAWQPISRNRLCGRCTEGRWHRSCSSYTKLSILPCMKKWISAGLPAIELNDNLSGTVVIHFFKFSNVSYKWH